MKIRVIRLIEFVGDRQAVEEQVKRSLHGSRWVVGPKGYCQFTAITIGEFSESVTADRNGECLERVADILTDKKYDSVEEKLELIEVELRKHRMPQFNTGAANDAQNDG